MSIRFNRTVAGALAAAALAAPAADARPAQDPVGAVHSSSSAELGVPDAPVTRTVETGIDWGSAAIGAGGAAAVLLLTAGGAAALSHRQRGIDIAH
jgi:hypothetical protein